MPVAKYSVTFSMFCSDSEDISVNTNTVFIVRERNFWLEHHEILFGDTIVSFGDFSKKIAALLDENFISWKSLKLMPASYYLYTVGGTY